MRPSYDFSAGIRGKYARRLDKGANVVVLDRDVAEIFPDSKAVNHALRARTTRRSLPSTLRPRWKTEILMSFCTPWRMSPRHVAPPK
jgi:hypothetical protein